MQNSSLSSPTSNSIVAKLLEVDADLAAQEVALTLQLVSIQEKRHSLKNVIAMFAPRDVASTESIITPAQTPVTAAEVQSAEVEAEPTELNITLPELEDGKTDTPADVQVSAKGAKRQTKTNSSPSSSKPAKKSGPANKPTLGSSMSKTSLATLL